MATTEQISGGILETYTPEEVHDLFQADKVILIDVRTPVEYAFEHVKGALLLPLSCFDTRHLPDQSAKPIIFYCGSGVRSRIAAQKIFAAAPAADNTKVRHMQGGFGAWKQSGFAYLGTNLATGAPADKLDKAAA